MANLRELGLDELLRERLAAGVPVLGICLGMQLAFERSTELGGADGLGVIAGEVRPLDHGQLKLPHIGWNEVSFARSSPLLDGLPERCTLYGLETMDGRVPTFAFRVDGMSPRDVAERLAAREIAVWDGDYYAVEAMTRLGLQPDGAVRTGFVHYNTFDEVDRLLAVLAGL